MTSLYSRAWCTYSWSRTRPHIEVTEGGGTVWNKGTPNSTRFCRPIAVRLTRETPSLVLHVKQTMDEQITELNGLKKKTAGVTCRYTQRVGASLLVALDER